jgi:UDP-glucose 4-epimerase
MKVLVSGGAGYIGSHTVRELKNSGHDVVVLDTLELGHAEAVAGTKLIKGSITDAALVEEIFKEEKPQAVMDFAAYKAAGESVGNPLKYFQNNVGGPLNLLETMVRHEVPYYIFSSSCSVFGTPRNLPASETNNPFGPESPYGESKLTVEKMLGWVDKAYNLRYVALRYFNAAGAALDGTIGEDWSNTYNLVPLVMKAALGVTPSIKVFGTDYPTPDGTAVRDYIHVVDLAQAHVKALEYLERTNQSNAFNLGTGQGSSVKEVIDTAIRVSQRDIKVELVARRPGDPAAIWADASKAERELGWKARYDLETIIQTAWNWHSQHPHGFSQE